MKTMIKNVMQKLPGNEKILEVYLNKKFKVEIDLLDNKHKWQSDSKSIIHFSINKAATQYVKSILRKIANENALIPVNFSGYAFNSEFPYLDHLTSEEMDAYKHVFKPKGYLYSVFGGMIRNIDNFENYNIILSLRDPRDILVSDYYSIAYSHSIPPITSNKREYLLKRRDWANSINIDQFVLKERHRVFSIFNEYKQNLLVKKNDVSIVYYEKMISDFEGWIKDIVSKAEILITPKMKKELMKSFYRKKPKKENRTKHVRKGISGEYKEKLNPKTIEILNSQFNEVLDFFGYEI